MKLFSTAAPSVICDVCRPGRQSSGASAENVSKKFEENIEMTGDKKICNGSVQAASLCPESPREFFERLGVYLLGGK